MLVDRLGARGVLVIGGVVNGLGTLAAAAHDEPVRPSPAALLVAGIGGSAVPVAGMSSLMRAFAPERRGVVMGWRQLAVPLGGTIGAVTLPLLADAGGVRLALVACAVAVTRHVGRVRPAGRPRARRRHGRGAAAAFATCCGCPGSGRRSPSRSSTSSA